MSRHTKYIQKMLNDLDNGVNEVLSPDKLVKFKYYTCLDVLVVEHYGTIILTIAKDEDAQVGRDAYSDTDVRIINQVLEHYKFDVVAHRHKDCIYLE